LLASAFQLASIPSSIFAAHGALHAPLELHHPRVFIESLIMSIILMGWAPLAILGQHSDSRLA